MLVFVCKPLQRKPPEFYYNIKLRGMHVMHLYCVYTQCAYAIALGRTGQMHEEIEREREREAWEFSIYSRIRVYAARASYTHYIGYINAPHTHMYLKSHSAITISSMLIYEIATVDPLAHLLGI